MKTEDGLRQGTRVRRLERTALVISRAILRCHAEGPVLDDTCRLLVQEAGYTMAWIGQKDDKGILPVAQAEVPPDYRPPQGPIAAALDPVRAALHEDRPRVAQDLGKGEGGLHVHAAEHGYSSQCAVPLRLADGPGVLVAYSRDPQAFQAEEVALLWEIAGDLEHGVRRLREMALREQQELELREAKAHYDLFYEDSPVPSFMASLGGRITSANHAFARLLGKDRAEEVLQQKNMSLYTIMTPMDKNRLFDHSREEEPAPVELTFFSSDHGSTQTCVSAHLVSTEDGPRLKVHAQALGDPARARHRPPSGVTAGAGRREELDHLIHQVNNAMTPVLNHVELALSAAEDHKDRHLKAAQEAVGRLAHSVKHIHGAERERTKVATYT